MRKTAKGCEFTKRKSNGVRVHHEKKSDTETVDHEKKSDGVKVHHEKKSNGVRVHHKTERWAESSQSERVMG